MSVQKAWHYKEYGSVDVLEFGDFAVPEIISPDQVLLKVQAAAINPIDFKRRQGYIRGTDAPLPYVPGYDVAGVVVKVGSEVKNFKEGDEVYGDIAENGVSAPKRYGTLAQYTVTEEKVLALKPQALGFAEAASLPLAVLTAQGSFDRANFQAGQTTLIIGGAGGVGSLAIQLAKHVYGASLVATTASTGKLEFVKSLGADVAIDYTKSNYYEASEKYDFVYDTVGDAENAAKAVKKGGVVLTIADFQAKPPVILYVLTASGANLAKLNPFLESKKLKPIIDPKGRFSFSQVKEAFNHLETGRAVGKVVIAPID